MKAMKSPGLRNPWQVAFVGGVLFVLGISETLLLFDVLSENFGIGFEFYYEHHLVMETLAVFILGISLIVVGATFWHILRENRDYRAKAGLASGEFLRGLGVKFDEWELSDSESEIALLLIKGLTIQEIANVRSTKPGTIKSQSNAVYRKAEVKSRNELVAYFVEDLLGGQDLTAKRGAWSP